MRHSTTNRKPGDRTRQATLQAARQIPLGDSRFQELIKGASAYFAVAERDVEAEKAQAIPEIQGLMKRCGLTAEDLVG